MAIPGPGPSSASASSSVVVAGSPRRSTEPKWEVILRTRLNGVVLWDQERNALRLEASDGFYSDSDDGDDDENDGLEVISSTESDHISSTSPTSSTCPLCLQQLPGARSRSRSRRTGGAADGNDGLRPPRSNARRLPSRKDTSYFSLLSEANSRTQSPRETNRSEDSAGTAAPPGEPLAASSLNSGYYSRFFVEIDKLGKGGSGTVHLVRHVLNGENLGLYACKKIAIGASSSRLPELLREVHLLEALQHPNLVQYHHVWVEECRLSPYGPPVPTLHLLMAYANAGDLGSFVARRSGGGTDCTPEERVRRFRMRNLASVHLLRVDEIISIFKDCCEGLAFLHGRNILHLDIKAENILLHWEEDALLPCAKISDLGSSDTTKESSRRTRSGGSGTLDWTPPEAWERDPKTQRLRTPDRSTDLWSLGLILYLLSFFTLPYHETDDVDLLEKEIRAYPGFFIADALKLDHGTRHDLPTSLLRIISRLVHRDPSRRPSCVETIALLQIVSDQIESDESSLPVETSALVKQHSSSSAPLPPSPTSLALPSDLPFEDASEELTSLNLVASPESKRNLRKWALIRRRQPLTRLPLFKVYLAVGAVMKALSVQRLCRSAPLTPFALYAVLIPTLVDATLADPWLSLVLWGVHLVVLMGLGGLREGLCTISFVDLDGV